MFQAFVHHDVACAALRSAQFHRIAAKFSALVLISLDSPADINCAIEGLLFQLIALLEIWSTRPGVLDGALFVQMALFVCVLTALFLAAAGVASSGVSLAGRLGLNPDTQVQFRCMAIPMAQAAIERGSIHGGGKGGKGAGGKGGGGNGGGKGSDSRERPVMQGRGAWTEPAGADDRAEMSHHATLGRVHRFLDSPDTGPGSYWLLPASISAQARQRFHAAAGELKLEHQTVVVDGQRRLRIARPETEGGKGKAK